ncbi:ATPase, T2SS/T4P/T4SS family [Vibrio sp. PP-XX7]
MRALLRQDPDIIMIGEIRDKETATIALRAAQTGHLVLSTLHTNSAKETFTRLLQMDFAPYQLLSTIRLIVAQRLVRKLCPHCRIPISPDKHCDQKWQLDTVIYQPNPQGCHACLAGYQGRIGIYEMLAPEPADREQPDHKLSVQQHPDQTRLVQPPIQTPLIAFDISQFTSHQLLWHDGIQKVRQGLTALEELYRILESPDATGEYE